MSVTVTGPTFVVGWRESPLQGEQHCDVIKADDDTDAVDKAARMLKLFRDVYICRAIHKATLPVNLTALYEVTPDEDDGREEFDISTARPDGT